MPPVRLPHASRRRRAMRRATWAARARILPAAAILAAASAVPGVEAVSGIRPDRDGGGQEEAGAAGASLPAWADDLLSDAGSVVLDFLAEEDGDDPRIGDPYTVDDGMAEGRGGNDGSGDLDADPDDIPDVAMRAYRRAERALGVSDPECGLEWSLLAAIGRVESDHGRFGGAVLDRAGDGSRPIRGLPLDGRPGVATIRDTDNGALDGDERYDRAVGPMQFIPSTWARVAVDANADGESDPNNIFDAALGAAVYLCAGDTDLTDEDGLRNAIMRYNRSSSYVETVISLAEEYGGGDYDGPVDPGEVPDDVPSVDDPGLPPANVGRPPTLDPPNRRRPTTTRPQRPTVDEQAAPAPSQTPSPSPAPTPGGPPSSGPVTTRTTQPPTTPPPSYPWPTPGPSTPGTDPTGPPPTTPRPTDPPPTTPRPTDPPPTTPPPTDPPPTTPPPTDPPPTDPPPGPCDTEPGPSVGVATPVSGQLPSGPYSLTVSGDDTLACVRLTLPSGSAPAVENTADVLTHEWRVNSADGRHVLWGLAPADVTLVQVTVMAPDGDDPDAEPDRLEIPVTTVAGGVDGLTARAFAADLPEGGSIVAISGVRADGTVAVEAVDVEESLAPVAGFDPTASAYVTVVDAG